LSFTSFCSVGSNPIPKSSSSKSLIPIAIIFIVKNYKIILKLKFN